MAGMDLSVEPYGGSDNDTEAFELKPIEKKNRLSAEPVVVDPNSSLEVRYGECMRNHAASIGGHASDGCGEFMPDGGGGSLICAACGCHRNFHKRREMSIVPVPRPTPLLLQPPHHHHRNYGHHGHRQQVIVAQPLQLNSPPPHFQRSQSNVGPAAFNHIKWGRMHADGDDDDEIDHGGGGEDDVGPDYDRTPDREDHPVMMGSASSMMRGKRYRTKFTRDQKDRMREYADKLGWRMQRHDDVGLNQFCAEIGVTRNVFKVWMHNNKSNSSNALRRHDSADLPPPPSVAPSSPPPQPPSAAPPQPAGV